MKFVGAPASEYFSIDYFARPCLHLLPSCQFSRLLQVLLRCSVETLCARGFIVGAEVFPTAQVYNKPGRLRFRAPTSSRNYFIHSILPNPHPQPMTITHNRYTKTILCNQTQSSKTQGKTPPNRYVKEPDRQALRRLPAAIIPTNISGTCTLCAPNDVISSLSLCFPLEI